MLLAVMAICIGASLGALLRWGLGIALNAALPLMPLGTLAANILGGYLVGIAVGLFSAVTLAAEWRLFVITGFLGGLTTFSTFSAEVMELLQTQNFGWAIATIAAHVAGSLAATFLGLLTYSALFAR